MRQPAAAHPLQFDTDEAVRQQKAFALQVGIVGLGRMGSAVAARLAETGPPALTWTRSGRGATTARLADLAGQCAAILTFVSGEEANRAIYEGSEGLFATAPESALLINHATLSPRVVTALAAEARAAGRRFVEAPVLGTVGPARAGALVALLGAAPGDADEAAATLARYCRIQRLIGAPGAGAAMKIVHNSILSLYWASVADAFTFGRAAGLKTAAMVDVIGDSFAAIGQWPLKRDLLKGEGGEVGFPIAALAREIAAMQADYAGAGAPGSGLARARALAEAARDAGWGLRDVAELALFGPPTQ